MSRKVTSADKVVGSRVRLRRKQLGITQEQLGEALGLTFQQVQKYEHGTNRIGAVRLAQICRILDVPMNYFFEGMSLVSDSGPELKGPSSALSLPGAAELLNWYSQIQSPRMRKALREMAEHMAREPSAAEPATQGSLSSAAPRRSRAR